MPKITLANAAAEMFDRRRKAKAGELHLTDLRCRSAPTLENGS
jgi:hypothetical protein